MQSNLMVTALGLVKNNVSIIPVRADGSKAPDSDLLPEVVTSDGEKVRSWSEYRSRKATNQEVMHWFKSKQLLGIGVVCGSVSGNLEVIDFDTEDLYEPWLELVKASGGEAILSKCARTKSPKGWHIAYRCTEAVEGNQKLASKPKEDGKGRTALIETRGEGGYVLAPGCPPQCNPLGVGYVAVSGDLRKLEPITPEERTILLDAARTFDQCPKQIKPEPMASSSKGDRPGDHFNERSTWAEVLEPAGWRKVFTHSGVTRWSRPGKSFGISATTNYAGTDLLYVFSSNAYPLEPETAYSKFSAYAWLNHAGNFEAAASALAARGYGAERKAPSTEPKAPQVERQLVEVPDFSDPEQWGEPILFGKIDTPELSAEIFPEWLRSYVVAVSKHTQTPVSLSVMQALSVLATCFQRCFEVSPYGDGYSEPLNIWTITALPPASRKTAVISALTSPLVEWEREQAEAMRDQCFEVESQRAVASKRISKLQERAAGTEDPAEREGMLSEIVKLKQSMPEELRPPRLWTGDVTPERLQGLLVENGEAMSLLSDEAGIFEIMAGLYSDGKANIDVFLQGHAGAAVRVERGERTAYLDKPALTFGLAVQPQIISDLCSGSKRRFRGIGTLARFLYCLPASNIGKRVITDRKTIAPELVAQYHAHIKELLSARRRGQVQSLSLTSDAIDSWHRFSQYIESRQGEDGDLAGIQDWTGKLPGAALRIAGLVHLASNLQSSAIDKGTIDAVLDFCESLIPHAQAAFQLMEADASIEDAKFAFDWILKNCQQDSNGCFLISQRDLFRTGRFGKGKQDRVLKALAYLQERNITSCQHRLPTRKPTYVFYINPVLITKDGAR